MLQIRSLSKTFSGAVVPALRDLSLDLQQGDFCVVIGANGSGKSTLLKSLSGEVIPDSGTIHLDGKNITSLPIYRRAQLISGVSQDINKGTIPEMTLLENMALSSMRVRSAHFCSYEQSQTELMHHIAQLGLGLENHVNKPLSSLSGGQRQMVAMLMSVISPPQLLLLDEHCSALDPKTSVALMELTADIINKQNITTLMITHNLHDAIRFGNRLIMMQQGQKVLDISGAEKTALTASELLNRFHHIEGQSL